jgi:hypothetical protein
MKITWNQLDKIFAPAYLVGFTSMGVFLFILTGFLIFVVAFIISLIMSSSIGTYIASIWNALDGVLTFIGVILIGLFLLMAFGFFVSFLVLIWTIPDEREELFKWAKSEYLELHPRNWFVEEEDETYPERIWADVLRDWYFEAKRLEEEHTAHNNKVWEQELAQKRAKTVNKKEPESANEIITDSELEQDILRIIKENK